MSKLATTNGELKTENRTIKKIDTGNRIRDIIYDKSSNSYFMYQENTNLPKVVKISKITDCLLFFDLL